MHELPIIQGLWIGNHLSLLEQLSIKSFLAHGYTYHLYSHNKIENVPRGVVLQDANTILPWEEMKDLLKNKIATAHIADYFRYLLIYRQGNVWADLDTICLRPIQLDVPYIFGWDGTQHSQIANGFFGAPAGCKLLYNCLNESKNIIKRRKHKWEESGPQLFSKQIKNCSLEPYAADSSKFYPLHWTESYKIICEKLPAYEQNQILEQSETLHVYNETFRKGLRRLLCHMKQKYEYGQLHAILHYLEFNKNKLYSPHTLLGKLQEKYLDT
ncbi:MAG: glycosyltransferase [Candidatus Peribacteraceae bacterium]|nr:glycosyltransferase [Candidatus Peribacteraceae bacterium]